MTTFRLPVTAMMLGLVLVATPSFAKSKRQKMREAAEASETTEVAKAKLPVVVDMNVAHDPQNVLFLDLSDGGRVAIRLMPQWAPNSVERIKTLTSQGFYNGLIFHRVIEGFMAQTGDPTGTGQGGSKLPDLHEEFNSMPHLRGTVAMARTNDPNSANSQFFIMFYPRFALDHKYTIIGRVIQGMQYVDAIHRGEPPANPTKIIQASLASEHKAPPAGTAPDPASITASDLSHSSSN